MKRIILLALSVVPAAVWAQSNSFSLKAKIWAESAPAKAYLSYRLAGQDLTDSAIVDKGTFLFKGVITEPVRAQLVLDHKGIGLAGLGNDADFVMMYLESGSISITGKDSVKTAQITGSKLNDEDKKYKSLVAVPEKIMATLNTSYQAATEAQRKDEAFMNGLQEKYNKAQGEERVLQQEFVKQNSGSYRSLLILMDLDGPDMDLQVIEPLYKSLAPGIIGTPAGQDFAKTLTIARATAVGAMAPVFIQNDVNDKPVSLTSFRGKYVLLDFWASWCGPCRGENPNVVKAYNQYKTKNFTVLGVSLDRPGKKDDWLGAIKADGLEWTQVSDLKFWNNAVAKQYGIQGIPQNFLIDPAGKIIAKNLRGDDLNKKLNELFNK